MQEDELPDPVFLSPGALALCAFRELKHPLVAALTSAMLLKRLLGEAAPRIDPEPFENVIAQIEHWVVRSTRIMQRMRALGETGRPVRRSEELGKIVSEALRVMERDLGGNAAIVELQFDGSTTKLLCDPGQIQHVIANLAINAIEACADRSVPRVTIRSSARGEWLETIVEDNGPGIIAGADETNFEPFFTTKLNGVGLGLPIARSIVEAHGGRLWCEPMAGGGASFRFILPAAAHVAA